MYVMHLVPGPKEAQRVGDYWYCPELLDDYLRRPASLSTAYWELTRPFRHPIRVCMPGGFTWLVDGIAGNLKDGAGWTVLGEPDDLTVWPALRRHGRTWSIKSGIITEVHDGK